MEDRNLKQSFLGVGICGRGKDIRRVNMVEIVCTHV
jgi:hypothetical protein